MLIVLEIKRNVQSCARELEPLVTLSDLGWLSVAKKAERDCVCFHVSFQGKTNITKVPHSTGCTRLLRHEIEAQPRRERSETNYGFLKNGMCHYGGRNLQQNLSLTH